MRSRRLIKKLSKSLAEFYPGAWLFDYDEELYYREELVSGGSAKGIPHIGGGVDYMGEGEDCYTVLEAAEQNFHWWVSFCGCQACKDSFDIEFAGDKCKTVEAREKLKPSFKNLKKALQNA